jgi:thiol-disulfide isomerase/thioredoxin
MTVRTRWLAGGLVVAAALVIALWPRSSETPRAVPPEDLAGVRSAAALAPCAERAPAVTALAGTKLECLADGTSVDLGGALAGRAALVNVWATWCEPCKEELPVLAGYAAEPGAVPVVGVAYQSPTKDALELLTRLGVRFANLADPEGAAVRALRAPNALPASYVIGTDGSVHFVTDPRLFRSVDAVRQAVARYVPPNGSGRP